MTELNPGSTLSKSVGLLLLAILMGLFAFAVTMAFIDQATLAAPPIEGNPISILGPSTVPGNGSGVIRTVGAPDLDNDGHADLAFGQGSALRVQANTGLTITQWAAAVTAGNAAHTIRDVQAVDLDRDGAVDLVSASADDSGNSELRLWQNPGAPFAGTWATYNTLATSAISLTTVAAADLDRNGTPDLVSGGLDGVLRLWSNPLTGTQAFGTVWPSPVTIATGSDQVRRVLIVDLDRDGWPDVVEAAGDGSAGAVRLWQNPGDPFGTTWAVSTTLGSFAAPAQSLAVGDLDNDGWLDVIAGLTNGQIVTWQNSGDPFTVSWGGSAAVGDLSLPIESLSVGDADGDGRQDLFAVASGAPSSLVGWRSTGQPFSGGWDQIALGAPSDTAFDLTVADVNRDGDLDLVTASGNTDTSTGSLQLWVNARIRTSARFETPNVSNSVANAEYDVGLHAMDVHDMDRDGRPDIVVATLHGALFILENNGSPFVNDWPRTDIGTSPGFFSVVAGDLDGDGWPDIATSAVQTRTGNHVHIWQNDGTPFSGTWISQTAGTFPRQVMDLALGDVAREGHLQIVAATGITTTFENYGQRNVPTSDDNRIWLLRPPVGDVFASNWLSSTMCDTTYSANGLALGDLDNDGWTDVAFVTDHAPEGSEWPDTSDWPDAYQVRACRNLGDPYTSTGWQDYNIGRDDAPVSVTFGHTFWGAHMWGVDVGDLDNDGYLDVVAGGGAEGDYQILVFKNDNTPFDGNIWAPTAIGYGLRSDDGPTSCPGTYPEDCPWLETSIPAVNMGDLNGDGKLDIVSGFGRSFTILPLWFNTGTPFGATVTDTHWARYDLGLNASRPVYGIEAVDLDTDGRLDVAAVTSWDPYGGGLPATGPLRVWRNLGGVVRHNFETDYDNTTIQDGESEAKITFAVKNNGRDEDHDLEIDVLRVRLVLNNSTSNPMTNGVANALFRSLQIYRDADDDDTWQFTDSPVVTVTSFVLDSGWLTFYFPSGEAVSAVAPGETETFFLILNMEPDASQVSIDNFRIYYTSHEDLVARDTDTRASLSVEEDAWRLTPWTEVGASPAQNIEVVAYPTSISADGVSTSTVTATVTTAQGYPVLDGTPVTFTTSAGSLPATPYVTTTTDGVATAVLTSEIDPATATVTVTASVTATGTVNVEFQSISASLRINDAPGPDGTEVTTHTLNLDQTLTVYAAAYDAGGVFIGNPTDVTWGGTGAVSGHLSPTESVSSTTFVPALVGTGTITLTDGSGLFDATGTITVTEVPVSGLTASNDSPTELGGSTTLTATIAGGSNVGYAWSFGDGETGAGAVVVHQYPAVGSYTATVTATNSAGEMATTTLVTVADVPVSGLAASNDSPTELGGSTTLTATIAAGSNVSYAWSFGDGETGVGAVVTHQYAAVGSYTATVTATNSAGEVVTTTLVTVTDVPVSGLAASNDSPTELGGSTTLTATIAAGSNVSYAWSFGDGEAGVGAVVTHQYAAVGSYTATVTATNSAGEMAITTLVTVADVPDEPITGLTASSDSPIVLGDTATLTATIAGGSNVGYAWSFGDGETGTGAVIQHTYEQVGTFTAIVTATNDSSVITATTNVVVEVGALSSIIIRDAPNGAGSVVGTRSLSTDDNLTLYAAGYDRNDNYISDIAVSWDVTDDLDTVPAGPSTSVIFAPTTAGTSGTITADDGQGHTDASGTISVSVGVLAQIVILDTADGGVVEARNITTGNTLTLYAAGYDADGNFIADVTVSWGVTGDLDAVPAGPSTKVTFAPVTAGTSGTITADDGQGHTDATGTISVAAAQEDEFKVFLPIVIRGE